MSNSSSIEWFSHLLFGGRSNSRDPPIQLYPLLARMQVDGLKWQDFLHTGGLVSFPYQIHSDLYQITEYFENGNEPVFKTKIIQRFFDRLSCILARKKSENDSDFFPIGPSDDVATLNRLLVSNETNVEYRSAQFWGETTRRLLNHRRPLPKELSSVTPPSDNERYSKRAVLLFDITRQTRGETIDPLSTFVVPSSEYVNAVHWQSVALLESFIATRPDHVLSKTVCDTILKNIHRFLCGIRPSIPSDALIDTFLGNVVSIHQTIRKVPSENSPPKIVDVFHRLLALTERDHMWQENPNEPIESVSPDMDLFQLSERLYLAERQNKILIREVRSD